MSTESLETSSFLWTYTPGTRIVHNPIRQKMSDEWFQRSIMDFKPLHSGNILSDNDWACLVITFQMDLVSAYVCAFSRYLGGLWRTGSFHTDQRFLLGLSSGYFLKLYFGRVGACAYSLYETSRFKKKPYSKGPPEFSKIREYFLGQKRDIHSLGEFGTWVLYCLPP